MAEMSPALPSLGAGLQLLDTEDRLVEALHTLVLDHLLTNDGATYWVDSRGHATTTSLARLAPSRGLLDRIRIARGFTAYQHYSIVETLAESIDERASLVVVPWMDYWYRGDDLARGEPEAMLDGVLTRLESIGNTLDVPVLVTREQRDELAQPIAARAEAHLACEQTRFGPRFASGDFETLVYPIGGGRFQTTIAYWREILAARIEAAPPQPAEGVAYGAD